MPSTTQTAFLSPKSFDRFKINKRHNRNGNQKKPGNSDRDDAKSAHTLKRPANETTVEDNPIDLI